jgi:hypothetical protein
MTLKNLTTLGAALLLAVSIAVPAAFAAPGHGKGPKPDKPMPVLLKGDLVSVSDGSFVMSVDTANRAGRVLVGSEATVAVSEATRIVRDDAKATLADLQPGDQLVVQIRAKRGDQLSEMQLVARAVIAESAASDGDDGDAGSGD